MESFYEYIDRIQTVGDGIWKYPMIIAPGCAIVMIRILYIDMKRRRLQLAGSFTHHNRDARAFMYSMYSIRGQTGMMIGIHITKNTLRRTDKVVIHFKK